MSADSLIQQAANLVRQGRNIVVLTGAGVSKESGVPTFRDAMDGLWARYDPEQLATPQAFQRNPKLVWDWYEYRREMVKKAAPNPGHFALAELERRATSFTLITQNVDDLHEQAGSKNIIHLHGSIARSKCFFDCQGEPTLVDVSQIEYDHAGGPPPCPHCGRWVRPDVVWFGEMLPIAQLDAAKIACIEASVMLVIGTSGLVTPAATLPQLVRSRGAKIIEVNPGDSLITAIADLKLDGPSGEALPQLLEALDRHA